PQPRTSRSCPCGARSPTVLRGVRSHVLPLRGHGRAEMVRIGQETMEQTELLLKVGEQNHEIIAMLSRIEQTPPDTIGERGWYAAEKEAARLNRAEDTVRQWLNRGQAQAKKVHGKGRCGEWRIVADEVRRLECEGPLPVGTFDNHQTGHTIPYRR